MTSSIYFIPIPLNIQPHFSFVEVFRESTAYCRIYKLPFDMISICTREDPQNPSFAENMETGEIYRFKENDISFMPRNIPARYTYTTANEHLCIHFRLELFPGVDVFSGEHSRKVIHSRELRQRAETIFKEQDPILKLAGCQEFALNICRMHWPQKYTFNFEALQVYEPVLRHVRAHVSAEMQIAELAQLLGFSEGYFSRNFHRTFGESPKQYLQKELFWRAARLLSNPAMNVKSTAVELRFSSEFYFSKFFKRLSSLSPLEYRKRSAELLGVSPTPPLSRQHVRK